jgi:hypothetical protein
MRIERDRRRDHDVCLLQELAPLLRGE